MNNDLLSGGRDLERMDAEISKDILMQLSWAPRTRDAGSSSSRKMRSESIAGE